MGLDLTIGSSDPTKKPARFDLGKPLADDGGLRVIEDGAVLCAVGTAFPRRPVDMEANLKVAFEIVFGEPRVVRGEPVLHLLHQMTGLTDSIVNLFDVDVLL
jgi:hypothetical protein